MSRPVAKESILILEDFDPHSHPCPPPSAPNRAPRASAPAGPLNSPKPPHGPSPSLLSSQKHAYGAYPSTSLSGAARYQQEPLHVQAPIYSNLGPPSEDMGRSRGAPHVSVRPPVAMSYRAGPPSPPCPGSESPTNTATLWAVPVSQSQSARDSRSVEVDSGAREGTVSDIPSLASLDHPRASAGQTTADWARQDSENRAAPRGRISDPSLSDPSPSSQAQGQARSQAAAGPYRSGSLKSMGSGKASSVAPTPDASVPVEPRRVYATHGSGSLCIVCRCNALFYVQKAELREKDGMCTCVHCKAPLAVRRQDLA